MIDTWMNDMDDMVIIVQDIWGTGHFGYSTVMIHG